MCSHSVTINKNGPDNENGGATNMTMLVSEKPEHPVDERRGRENRANPIGWAVITALVALRWAVIRLREASPMPPRASPSLRTPRKPPDRMRFGRGVLSLLLIVMLMSGSATAVKVTEHSCYTGLDPETATSMNCYNKGLTGAYYGCSV